MDDDTWALLFTELAWVLERENPKQPEDKVKYSNPNQSRKNQINKILNKNG